MTILTALGPKELKEEGPFDDFHVQDYQRARTLLMILRKHGREISGHEFELIKKRALLGDLDGAREMLEEACERAGR